MLNSNTEDDLSKYMIPQDIIKKFWGEHSTHVPSVSIAHLQELLSSTKDARKVGECDVVERWKTRGTSPLLIVFLLYSYIFFI